MRSFAAQPMFFCSQSGIFLAFMPPKLLTVDLKHWIDDCLDRVLNLQQMKFGAYKWMNKWTMLVQVYFIISSIWLWQFDSFFHLLYCTPFQCFIGKVCACWLPEFGVSRGSRRTVLVCLAFSVGIKDRSVLILSLNVSFRQCCMQGIHIKSHSIQLVFLYFGIGLLQCSVGLGESSLLFECAMIRNFMLCFFLVLSAWLSKSPPILLNAAIGVMFTVNVFDDCILTRVGRTCANTLQSIGNSSTRASVNLLSVLVCFYA